MAAFWGLAMSAAPLVTGSVQPMVMSLYKLAPEHRYGQAVAMRVIVINASSVSIPMLSGVAGSLIGAAGVFWGSGFDGGRGRQAGAWPEAPTSMIAPSGAMDLRRDEIEWVRAPAG